MTTALNRFIKLFYPHLGAAGRREIQGLGDGRSSSINLCAVGWTTQRDEENGALSKDTDPMAPSLSIKNTTRPGEQTMRSSPASASHPPVTNRGQASPRTSGIVIGLTLLLGITVGATGSGWYFVARGSSRMHAVTPSGESRPDQSRPVQRDHFDLRLPMGPSPSTGEHVQNQAADIDSPSDQPYLTDPNLPGEEVVRLQLKHELSALESSGPASSTLTSNALIHVEALKRLPALAGAEFNEFKCFANGCSVTVTRKDRAAADAAGSAIIRSEDFLLWKGPKLRSGPMQSSSGQVQTIVILYREPDRAPPTPNQLQ